MTLPNFPADRKIAEGDGQLTNGFWLFLGNVARWIRANQNSAQMKQSTQAKLAALAATLTKDEAGLLVEVTDYGHILEWSGSAWTWGPGEQGSGMMALFEVDPTATGWHLYDGSTVSYLKADGTLGSVTLPDLVTSGAYLKTGAADAGPNAAVAPTFAGGTVGSAATGVTAATGTPFGTATFAQGTGASLTVASSLHTHAVTINDPNHTHTLSGVTGGTDAEPRNLVRRPFFRQ